MHIWNDFKRKMSSKRGSFVWVAIALTAVSGGVAAYGSYAQGQAGKKMNQYSADVAARQAEIEKRTAETNITLTQTQAAAESKQHARKMLVIEGAQKATEGAMGIASSVTAADIGASTFDTGKLDEMAIRYNADIKSWGIKSGADVREWDLLNQRNQYLMAGRNAAVAGNIAATSTLLSTASQTAYGVGKAKGYIT